MLTLLPRIYLATKPELVGDVQTSFQFKFRNPDSVWFIDLKSGNGGAGGGEIDKPDVTIELGNEHVETLFGGDLAKVQQLFFSGEMKVSGNVMASNKLSALSGMDPAFVEAARDRRLAEGTSATASSAPSKPKVAFAPQVFSALAEQVGKGEFNLPGDSQIQFSIIDPDSSWVLNTASGDVSEGSAETANTVITLSDDHLQALVKGERSAKDLYQHGDLRVDGDIQFAHQLEQFKGLA